MPDESAAHAAPPHNAAALPAYVDASLLDAAQRVAVDRKCPACGYNVRTLHVAAHCPECNCPVADAIRSDDLRYANRGWLNNIVGGAAALTVAHAIFAATLLLCSGLVLLTHRRSDSLLSIVPCGIVVGCVTWFVGTFALTAREPNTAQQDAPRRRSIRRYLLIMALTFVAAVVLRSIIGSVLAVVALVTFVAIFPLSVQYAADLLSRARDNNGMQRAKAVAAAAIVIVGLGLIGAVASTANDDRGIVFTLFALLPFALLSAAQAMCFRRLWRASSACVQAARLARERVLRAAQHEIPADVDPALLDVERRIDTDVCCQRCGHNLRHQHVAAGCPQCGEPVAASLPPPPKPASILPQVSCTVSGTNSLQIAFSLLTAACGLMVPAAVVGDLNPGTPATLLFAVAVLAALAAVAPLMHGVLRLTRPAACGPDDPPPRGRRLLRVLLTLTVAAAAFAIGAARMLPPQSAVLLEIPALLIAAAFAWLLPRYVGHQLVHADRALTRLANVAGGLGAAIILAHSVAIAAFSHGSVRFPGAVSGTLCGLAAATGLLNAMLCQRANRRLARAAPAAESSPRP